MEHLCWASAAPCGAACADAESEGLNVKQWLERYTTRGLGERACCADALTRCGDLTVQELAAETGKTLSSIRTAARRLETLHLVERTRVASVAKVYGVAENSAGNTGPDAPLPTWRPMAKQAPGRCAALV